ncbi:juvenile hormone epoxide hydrolase 1-like isoform X1 [Diabrotica virgifera virgifera]|uniref:Epoxide hydrolase n=1 Tax=Diabrotica virgifera virgifera TaxID=50390 RepID=A0ABM5IWE3_DIAVI|nr:juvenile hormone epoxide hydrolase 1-like isoform X1 [Diabrotica virgifera virgifera]
MGAVSCGQVLSALILVASIAIFLGIRAFLAPPPIPELGEKWWKASKPAELDTSVRPFKIQISEEDLQDLKNRLNRTVPLQSPLEDVKQHYGINTNTLKPILEFWKTKYDWRKREEFFNQYPQFKTNVQGLDIHFIHVRPSETKGVKMLPMLMLHGWPGSVREFYEIIPMLTKPEKERDFVFELIIPSVPGYGFSEGAEIVGLNCAEIAIIMKNLMDRLGFKQYYLQGGDWGAAIAADLAILFPEKVIGIHSNLCFVNTPMSNFKYFLSGFIPYLFVDEGKEHLVSPVWDKIEFLMLEFGYTHIQSTKPDTIGVALRDSPVGLAAYLLEKFTTWTNAAYKDLDSGGLTKKFTMEQLIDNVMIYWITRSSTTAMRLYAESVNRKHLTTNMEGIPVQPPSGCSRFEKEILWFPESVLTERFVNMVHISTHRDGGHFAAFEVPDVLAKDILQFTEIVERIIKEKS